jgi:hypothetical protein
MSKGVAVEVDAGLMSKTNILDLGRLAFSAATKTFGRSSGSEIKNLIFAVSIACLSS